MDAKVIKFCNWYAVFYISLSLLFITLTPFDFKWLASNQHLRWYFDYQDVVQNIFLFFPLGVVLKHTVQRNLALVVFFGALLSLLIELIQLYDIGRTSNYCDIIANTFGVLLGCLYYRYLVSLTNPSSLDIALTFMLMPLCWFIAMRSATQEFMAWLIAPLAIVALSIFKSSLYDSRLKWLTLMIWLVFSLVPLVYINRNVVLLSFFNFNLTSGIITLVAVPLILSRVILDKQLCFRVVITIAFLILITDVVWYLNRSFPISWTVPAHLHWIDILMSNFVVMFSIIWLKSKSIDPCIS